MTKYKLGFVGAGNMAEALIRGLIDKRVHAANEIGITDVSSERTDFLCRQFGVKVCDGNIDLINQSATVLLAVKPQVIPTVLGEVKEISRREQLFISIIAGTRTATIEDGLRNAGNPSPRLVRVMPNTPALVGLGVSGICPGRHATAKDLDAAEEICGAVGITTRVDESMMDAVTALTGSGPAYVFYVIEALIEAGVKVGFTEDQSRGMVLQMVLGAATLAKSSEKSPQELRRAVTSPKGTTEAGVTVLDGEKAKEIFVRAVQAAERRGRELGGASASSQNPIGQPTAPGTSNE
ncbi:pyrroline-5-carboxylate reductase [Candidatus Sumerlaeota bacterium]|nr:pyrroline-5-carboxylate reductase [Candidatus Sumerlaeota bacterium]